MRTPTEELAAINALEASAPVHFQLMGIDCWPIVRNTITSLALIRNGRSNKVGSIKDLILSIFDLVLLLLFPRMESVFIVSDIKYLTKINDVPYLKDTSVIRTLLEKSGYNCQVLMQSPASKLGKSLDTKSLQSVILVCSLLSRAISVFWVPKSMRTALDRIFLNHTSIYHLSSSHRKLVVRNIFFVIFMCAFFQLLLKRSSTKKCFIICYYSPLGMAICAACKKMEIESIDIQHGVSGKNMRAYARWSHLPKSGQNTLPETFFCWTDFDSGAINNWARNTTAHRARVSGNIWRQYLAEMPLASSAGVDHFVSQIAGSRRTILFSARSKHLPSILETIICKAPKDFCFLIRMHPNSINTDDTHFMKNTLSKYSAKCIVTSNLDIDLRDILLQSDIHITEQSATVYDALYEGIHSIIIDDAGADYFSEQIDAGYATFSKDTDVIMSVIENVSNINGQYPRVITLEEATKFIINGGR